MGYNALNLSWLASKFGLKFARIMRKPNLPLAVKFDSKG
ncbi:hypothetical protein CSUNSWCD_89 [Campylobacter showae CSUNSWCD]|uniref:Uncharacterized protein n=1 Tax=Campylobacter showae CSUNSWCD TaxID=1244083 RepID=M5IRK8_9BACT|nr:hypothetical protein CSUNSWCD_89 [Campylobacter showae CSUNSWCD]